MGGERQKRYMGKITIIDSSLRDGQHFARHQITEKQITNYLQRAEKARIPICVVGHGNGLGASSLHLGESLLSDRRMLHIARRVVRSTRLGAFAIPGFATLKDIDMAISEGVDVMFVASHCSEATATKQYIEYCVSKGIETYGVLMMSHMLGWEGLSKQAGLMKDYGAKAILFMDSAGALLPEDVSDRINTNPDLTLGFHPHNNLGLAVANAIAAVEAGATIIDGCTRGLGAGAGNVPLEVLVPVLHKMGYETGIDVDKLMDCAEYIKSQFPPQDITPLSITSGLNGVFSGFRPLVEKASKKYKVNPHKIFKELGKQKVVAGQEDKILEVAKGLQTHPIEALS